MKNFITKTTVEILQEQLVGKLILVHVFKDPKKDWFVYNSINKTNNDELLYLGASYKVIKEVNILENYDDQDDIYFGLETHDDGCVLFKADQKICIRDEYEILTEGM